MKQAFAVFCAIILIPSVNSLAWRGGPFSNNNALASGDDGIYEAVGVTTNGLGTYRWQVKNQSNAAGVNNITNVFFENRNVWYFQGLSYYGMCFGISSSTLDIISVIGNGSTDGTSSTSTVGPTGVVLTVTVGVVGPSTAPAPFGNIAYCNSAFTAKVTSRAPVKRFQGTGTVSFTGTPDAVTETIVFTDTIVSGSSTTTITRTTITSGGGNSTFNQQGAVRNFRVMGSQVSHITGF